MSQRNACFVAGGQGWAGPADHLVSHSTSPPSSLFRCCFSFLRTKQNPQAAWKGAASAAGSWGPGPGCLEPGRQVETSQLNHAGVPSGPTLPPGSLWGPRSWGSEGTRGRSVGRASWETIALLNFLCRIIPRIRFWGGCPNLSPRVSFRAQPCTQVDRDTETHATLRKREVESPPTSPVPGRGGGGLKPERPLPLCLDRPCCYD